ncbi:hypothetical protein FO519_004574 [Halicephalobus sp. NKZ332]|nr:hypothetical protein FO519_004574 [Halicephalobus sp. NKZ332]
MNRTKFPSQPGDDFLENGIIVVTAYISIFFDFFNIISTTFFAIVYVKTKTAIHLHFKFIFFHVSIFLVFRSILFFFPNFYYATGKNFFGNPSNGIFNFIHQVAIAGGFYAPLTIIEERMISALWSKTYEKWFSIKDISEENFNALGVRILNTTASICCSLCLIPFVFCDINMRQKLRCSGKNYTSCHKPLLDFQKTYIYAPSYKLNSCVIPNTLSTVMTAIMCLLYDTDRFLENNKVIDTEFSHYRSCQGLNEVRKLPALKWKENADFTSENAHLWTNVVVVREPLERFVSGFLDKCVIGTPQNQYQENCFGCKEDVSCFLRELSMAMTSPNLQKLPMDTHNFFPQSWYCEMGKYMYNNYTILKYSQDETEVFWDQLSSVFRKAEIPAEKINLIKDQLIDKDAKHSTFGITDQEKQILQQLTETENFKLSSFAINSNIHDSPPVFSCFDENYDYCHKPLLDFQRIYFYAPSHKLNACVIPKSLSTVMTAIVCLLYDTDGFLNDNRTINKEFFHEGFCDNLNEANRISALAEKENANYTDENAHLWTHMVVVRDPLERFVSGFLDKCVVDKIWRKWKRSCFECKDNLSCFLKRLDKTMTDPSIRKLSMDTHHFVPQSWYCEMGKYMYNNYTIVRYSRRDPEGLWDQLSSVFRKANVPEEKINIIHDQLVSGETRHSTFGLTDQKEKILKELHEPKNFKLFLKIYYYDYMLFGFPLPDIGTGETQ